MEVGYKGKKSRNTSNKSLFGSCLVSAHLSVKFSAKAVSGIFLQNRSCQNQARILEHHHEPIKLASPMYVSFSSRPQGFSFFSLSLGIPSLSSLLRVVFGRT